MKAPLLNPSFEWIPSTTHNTSEAFAARQKARMKAAQEAAKPTNVKPIQRRKAP